MSKKPIIIVTIAFTLVLLALPSYCQIDNFQIMSERQRAVWIDSMLERRMNTLLPDLMDRSGIDMWIIISREYNEDPVMKTMLPAEWLSARRRTILVFYNPGKGKALEKIAIARYDVGRLMRGDWNIDVYPDQWEALKEIIQKYNPKKIGINTSKHFGLADGLVSTEKEELLKIIGKRNQAKLVSAEKLAISWLETRSDLEITFYEELCALSRAIIMKAFDPQNMIIGQTNTDDIVWSLRQISRNLGVDVWFHPTVSIQRSDQNKFDHLQSFTGRPKDQVIQYGDLLHVDFGITYNRLNTDQQQHFYILRPGETKIPESLNSAFAKANRLQDILTSQFANGISGNQILKQALDQAKNEGIVASVYTHPIGFHGHAAGPTIGLWDNQGGVPGSGDYPVSPNTAYSIELNAASEIPEWNKVIRIMLEEDGWYNGNAFQYFSGRQKSIYPLTCNMNVK
jgi:Xaa-Pro aminopeptidase